MGVVISKVVGHVRGQEDGQDSLATREYYQMVLNRDDVCRGTKRVKRMEKEWIRVHVKKNTLMARCLEVICHQTLFPETWDELGAAVDHGSCDCHCSSNSLDSISSNSSDGQASDPGSPSQDCAPFDSCISKTMMRRALFSKGQSKDCIAGSSSHRQLKRASCSSDGGDRASCRELDEEDGRYRKRAALVRQQIKSLPADLIQLIMDKIIMEQRLDEKSAVLLGGAAFYDLHLDGYKDEFFVNGLPHLLMSEDFGIFPRETLERLVLSRTIVDDFFVTNLPGFPCLKELFLDCCNCVTDNSLIILSRLPNLEVLSLNHCQKVTHLSVPLIGGVKKLKKLSMESCLQVSHMQHLKYLKHLEELNLACCHSIRNFDAIYIGKLSTLKVLHVRNTGINDNGLVQLRGLTGLKKFSISGLKVQDASIAACIEDMRQLEDFNASRCFSAGNSMLRALAKAQEGSACLKRLSIMFTNISDAGLQYALPRLRSLEKLDVESCSVSDAGLVHVQYLRHLKSLQCQDTDAGNTTMDVLGQLPCLERLDVSYTLVDDLGLKYIGRISSLKHLSLESSSPFGDASFGNLTRLPHLQSLNLFGSRVTDSVCTILSSIKTLRTLDVSGSIITSYGVRQLARLPNLKHLSLAYSHRIADGSMTYLLTMKNLESLNISQCQISNAGLLLLSSLPHLKVLCLCDTNIKCYVLEKLMASSTHLEIKGLK